MCLACEEPGYFFRMWCADFVARGEMPPGVTPEDLAALGLPQPKATGTSPGHSPGAASANAFACDSPAE